MFWRDQWPPFPSPNPRIEVCSGWCYFVFINTVRGRLSWTAWLRRSRKSSWLYHADMKLWRRKKRPKEPAKHQRPPRPARRETRHLRRRHRQDKKLFPWQFTDDQQAPPKPK